MRKYVAGQSSYESDAGRSCAAHYFYQNLIQKTIAVGGEYDPAQVWFITRVFVLCPCL